MAAAILLLALGFAACGGDDDLSSTSSEADTVAQGQTEDKAGAGDSQQSGAEQGKEGSAAKDGKSGGGSQGGGGQSSGSSKFVPKQHSDSGGGSGRFVKKGGDNSVQEYGAEADSSEFDAAATVLHNFYDARAAGAWDAACGYLAQTALEGLERLTAKVKQLESASCGEILAKLVSPEAQQSLKVEAEEADARSFRFEGEQGFLIYTDADGTVFSMPMNNEGGSWKVGSLGASVLP